ncbi:phosphate/phosphite/phosphonate ABC transporter substrate-binding protein [Sporomusa acidovorans]|uniref:Phosphate-import protein PhnD n=1 Tax=Sporomusa acidovorans (strain ATCC 49682 / DSM 3132 / Mol) TaxID=1123286 RepID=A0ABZ3J239_SPOA4|nr:phosphate/phosphite/phosphonate ABC transporter substrate-binding protein [Sporomusa acidovorans]OZC15762.1 ABC transporter, phosphonate, periplasmic substrate-binding protein [Sporomusa acidovorans DSM 3132]SDF62995.1 phosphonate transport system substrate-binding protein [Sporomusa acidovorans]
MRKIFLAGMVITLMLVLAGCANDKRPYINFERSQPNVKMEQTDDENLRPIRIAVATVISPNETIEYYRNIAQYISKQIGRPTILVQRKTYEELNMVMSNGEADIAFMSTGAYSAYRGLTEIELLAMVEYKNSIFYDMQIIVHKDSDITSLEDLKGKSFAFTDPLSYSGHMAILQLLQEKNTRPEKYFGHYIYTYSHDKSIWAVANKATDAASIDSMIYQYGMANDKNLLDKIRVIETVGPNPTGPVVIREKISEEQKKQLRQVFLDMHKNPQIVPSLKGLLIDRFVIPAVDYYRPLQKIYDETRGIT